MVKPSHMMQYGATTKFINITHTSLNSQCQTNTPPGNSSGEQQLEKKYGLLFRYALMTILKSTQHNTTTTLRLCSTVTCN